MKPSLFGLALCLTASQAAADRLADFSAPLASQRPAPRPAAFDTVQVVPKATVDREYLHWLDGFRSRARAEGISDTTLNAAFRAPHLDTDALAKINNQAEFTKTLWSYLESAVSESRIENGRAAMIAHDQLLRQIEARYGVDRQVVVAIWGMESAYGSHRGTHPVIPALATLAYGSRRGKFFEGQLIDALRIIQHGDTTPEKMTGSWAGAMGHTQFIPSSYRALAVDWTGDGRRDIWSDDPADALASTANYLAESGWIHGQPWGVEVQLPQGFDYGLADGDAARMPSDWARLGVVGMDGQPVRDFGTARLLLPAGHKGAAFLTFKNFKVISRYNAADAYVIGVGHLADRIMGGAPILSDWPDDERALTSGERKELQMRLKQAGFDPSGVDGRIGPMTIKALRDYQRAVGVVPDGYASLEVLRRLR
ncbi:lytic murein transglycosylase [Salipiger sp. PrR002]|uniref:lytic murein transglycosylase n=1 Tax=Salipiger sp. PrR002 TaxID=2706489 RepID=UPI0013BE5B55|nr:lytic murein transglycosylase [Salipiger sp. PrR002]NDV98377.1 lytic murein transglycosylase [Salipiger sp. PrR002]NDW55089.1 lytic murein transglycosylase [Salipiger sp. PrR004]